MSLRVPCRETHRHHTGSAGSASRFLERETLKRPSHNNTSWQQRAACAVSPQHLRLLLTLCGGTARDGRRALLTLTLTDMARLPRHAKPCVCGGDPSSPQAPEGCAHAPGAGGRNPTHGRRESICSPPPELQHLEEHTRALTIALRRTHSRRAGHPARA